MSNYPYVNEDILEFLLRVFNTSSLLTKDHRGHSEGFVLGYIKGVQDVIDSLKMCNREQERGDYIDVLDEAN